MRVITAYGNGGDGRDGRDFGLVDMWCFGKVWRELAPGINRIIFVAGLVEGFPFDMEEVSVCQEDEGPDMEHAAKGSYAAGDG
jgi:hypothetical protein